MVLLNRTFLFIVPYILFTFSYLVGMDKQENVGKKYSQDFTWRMFGTDYYDPNVDPSTPISEVFTYSVKNGMRRGISDTAKDVVYNTLRFLPEGMGRFGQFIASCIYRLSFGSKGLMASDLAKMSNRIYAFCSPFTNIPLGSMDKKRRAALIQSGYENNIESDPNWIAVQSELINELKHAISYLKKNLPCYNLLYLPERGIRFQLARLVHAFTTEDSDQISFYIVRTISYISKLIELFEQCKREDEAYQKHDEIKRWLSWICNSFEQIALFLENEKSRAIAGRPNFSRVNLSNPTGLPALESLLGSSMTGNS